MTITAPRGAVNLLVTILYDTNIDIRKVFNEHFPAHVPDELVDFIIDTTDNVDEQIHKLVEFIHQYICDHE